MSQYNTCTKDDNEWDEYLSEAELSIDSRYTSALLTDPESLLEVRSEEIVCHTDIEDDDSSSEEEEEEESRPKKKKKKERYGGFILDECEVGEADEDDEWEEGASEYGLASESDEGGLTAQNIETYHHGKSLWETQKEDEIGEYLQKKYGEKPAPEGSFSEAGETSEAVAQQTLLPSIRDPNLWMVRCRVGSEKNTAFLLMRKFLTYSTTSEPLLIKSVVAPPGVKGYIYVEAHKQFDVKKAIENINNLRMGYHKQNLVPLKEMPAVLHITKKKPPVKPMEWVRVMRGLYKDDIALVDVVDLAQNEVELKLVPRIDFTKMRGALKNTKKETDEYKRKKRVRPPQKLFDPEAIRAIGGEVHPDGELLLFERQRYNRQGFLLKKFQISAILTDEVKPTLAELESFSVRIEDVNLKVEKKQERGKKHSFSVEDKVEVCVGELLNLTGKVLAIDGDRVTVMPKHQKFKVPLTFKASELRKFFKIGDHAKVIGGCFKGENGLVIRVTPPHVVLLSDTSNQEMTVFSHDVHHYMSVETADDTADDTAVVGMGQFKWGDMVQLDPEKVGVIVKMERQLFEVLDMNGELLQCTAASLQKKWQIFDLFALDKEHNQIRRGNTVKVLEGPHSGRSAEIKHLYRSHIFLYCCTYIQNCGMFVCKSRQLLLSGKSLSISHFRTGIDGYGSATPSIRSPMASPGQRWGGGNKAQIDRTILGKTVKVIGGPYKGNVGIIRDIIGDLVRIEAHSSSQHISVERRLIAIIGDLGQEGNLPSSARTPMRTPRYGSQTPSGSKTPLFGCKTPDWESGERHHYSFSMTPSQEDNVTPRNSAWDPNVTNTPARSVKPIVKMPTSTAPINYSPVAAPSPIGYFTSPVAYIDSSQNKPQPQPQGSETPDWDAAEKNNYNGTSAGTPIEASPKLSGYVNSLQSSPNTSFKAAGSRKSIFDPEAPDWDAEENIEYDVPTASQNDGVTSSDDDTSAASTSYAPLKATPKPFGYVNFLPPSTNTSFKAAIFDHDYGKQDRTDSTTSWEGNESEDWDAVENSSYDLPARTNGFSTGRGNNSYKHFKKPEPVRKSEAPTTIPTLPPYAVGFMNTAEASTYTSRFQQSSYNPQIPKIGVDSRATWVVTDVEVQIGAHDDADLVGQKGVIRSVSHGQCSLFLYQEERCIAIGTGDLVAVPPKPGDKFKMIRGDEKMPIGNVIGVVDQYTSLCMCNDEVKMIPNSYLCKMRSFD